MRHEPLLIPSLLFLVLGCSDQQNPLTQKPSRQHAHSAEFTLSRRSGDVTIMIQPEILPNRSVRIGGKTNLPKGTQLMISVEEKAVSGFIGQSKCSVEDGGRFQSEPFGRSDGLPEGVYVVDVVMPIVRLQPPHVQKIVGVNGERLYGPLVKRDALGVSVRSSSELNVGGHTAAAVQKRRVQERLQEYKKWYDTVLTLYRRLEEAHAAHLLDDPDNYERTRKWGEFARQWTQDADVLDRAMEATPILDRMYVMTPLGDLKSMFHTAAFRQELKYVQKKNDFKEAAKEFESFLAEIEKGK